MSGHVLSAVSDLDLDEIWEYIAASKPALAKLVALTRADLNLI